MLANTAPNANDLISGLLVSKDYSYTLLDARDLGDFAGLSTSVVTQRQVVNVEVSWELVKWHLESMFGTIVEGLTDDKALTLRVRYSFMTLCAPFKDPSKVMKVLDVKQTGERRLTLEWESSASNDMIADSALALIVSIDSSPATVKCMSSY